MTAPSRAVKKRFQPKMRRRKRLHGSCSGISPRFYTMRRAYGIEDRIDAGIDDVRVALTGRLLQPFEREIVFAQTSAPPVRGRMASGAAPEWHAPPQHRQPARTRAQQRSVVGSGAAQCDPPREMPQPLPGATRHGIERLTQRDVPGRAETRMMREHAARPLNGGVIAAGANQRFTASLWMPGERIQLQGASDLSAGFLGAREYAQQRGVPMIGGHAVGIDRDGLPQFAF